MKARRDSAMADSSGAPCLAALMPGRCSSCSWAMLASCVQDSPWVTDAILSTFGKLSNLQTLNLQGCKQLTGLFG
jgi:hypothetical protein